MRVHPLRDGIPEAQQVSAVHWRGFQHGAVGKFHMYNGNVRKMRQVNRDPPQFPVPGCAVVRDRKFDRAAAGFLARAAGGFDETVVDIEVEEEPFSCEIPDDVLQFHHGRVGDEIKAHPGGAAGSDRGPGIGRINLKLGLRKAANTIPSRSRAADSRFLEICSKTSTSVIIISESNTFRCFYGNGSHLPLYRSGQRSSREAARFAMMGMIHFR
mgnify:CR=1 FL=1